MQSFAKPLTDQEGVALVITLLILALLIAAGVGVTLSVQADLKTSSNLKTATQAFYIAEAGLERAKAEISGHKSFDSVLAGMDVDKESLQDNGILSFGAGASFAGGRYEVRVTDNRDDNDIWDDSDRKVTITATGKFGGSTRVIKVLVTKANLSFNAPLNVVDDRCELLFGESAVVDGHDKTSNPQDWNSPDPGPGPDVHGLARDCTTFNEDAFVPANKINDIQGLGGIRDLTSDLGSLTLAELQTIRGEMVSVPDMAYDGDTNVSTNLALGSRESPNVTHVKGTLTVSGTVTGAGILIVDNELRVTGNFAFEGLILIGLCGTCPGRMEISSTGSARIYGAVVLANATSAYDEQAGIETLAGRGAIYYSTKGIDLALRRTFKTLFWQEVFD
ncbi:MAG: PilX N-terminal domain-containing pilus assembly protein [Candidatus Binatia bacterium]